MTHIVRFKNPQQNAAPLINVSGRSNGKQLRIQFNAHLAKLLGLANFSYAEIAYDPDTFKLNFSFFSENADDCSRWSLGSDGGKLMEDDRKASRVINVSRKMFSILSPGRYTPHITTARGAPGVEITLTPSAVSAPGSSQSSGVQIDLDSESPTAMDAAPDGTSDST